MSVNGWTGMLAATFLLLLAGCEKETGTNVTGEITLSSQLHGSAAEGFYIYGYSFEPGEMYAYPRSGVPLPDIINEGYLVIEDGEEIALAGFNTPERVNGFALVGEFSNWEDANTFYQDYREVKGDLNYEILSDIIVPYQVWVQWTSSGKYVKMIIRDVLQFESDLGDPYTEVILEYTYAADGSMEFSCSCG